MTYDPDPTTFEDEDTMTDTEPKLTEFEILREQKRDMFAMLFDPNSVPKPPTGVEEPQSERGGTEPVDMISDHTPVDEELGTLGDELDVGLESVDAEEDL